MNHEKFSDVGYELPHNCVLTWPEADKKGEIRLVNSSGDTLESRDMGDEDYDEWRNLFPDDALYFQPNGAGDTGSKILSYQVYRSYTTAQAEHPEAEILVLAGDDVQNPRFLDVENPDLYWIETED